MIAFVINLVLGLLNLPMRGQLSKFVAGWCLGVACFLLFGHFGWLNDSTLTFMGVK